MPLHERRSFVRLRVFAVLRQIAPRPSLSPEYRSDYSLTRFSGLDQIHTVNAKTLVPKWTFSTGINRRQEAAPPVGDTM